MRSGIQFKEDGNIVFFLRPFVWSVMQLVRFFWDPKIAQLLTGPGNHCNECSLLQKGLGLAPLLGACHDTVLC